MNGKIFGFLITGLLATASLGFSQSNGSGPSQNATVTGVTNVTAIAGGNGGGSQAYAGIAGTPGPYGGFPVANGEFQQYTAELFKQVTMEMMESARGHEKVHCKAYFKPEDLPAENTDPINLIITWSPYGHLPYSDVKEIGNCDVQGKPFEPIEDALLAGLYEAKKELHATRCAAFTRELNQDVTKGFSVGTGGAGGAIVGPGTNNATAAAAAGGLIGTNRVYRTDSPEFRIICLSDGPSDLPPPPPPPDKKPVAAPQVTPPPVVQEAPAAPLPPPPAPTVVEPSVDDKLPEANVYFAYDHPKPEEGAVIAPTVMTEDGEKDNLAAISTIQQWLEYHSTVSIDVVGYACRRGSSKHNWDLSGRRADAVVLALKKDENIRNQVFEADSNGKESAANSGSIERNWKYRRVSFRIHVK